MTHALRRLRAGALLTSLLLPAACGDGVTFPPDFDPSLGVNLGAMTRTASGLYYQNVALGSGDPARAGQLVSVAYSGWLPSGRQFDAGSFSFTLGSGEVIAGFDEGVTGMRLGGKRKLVIPPELGYGNRGVGTIPPNSTLIFDVELLTVR